jgi:hypothetical protein
MPTQNALNWDFGGAHEQRRPRSDRASITHRAHCSTDRSGNRSGHNVTNLGLEMDAVLVGELVVERDAAVVQILGDDVVGPVLLLAGHVQAHSRIVRVCPKGARPVLGRLIVLSSAALITAATPSTPAASARRLVVVVGAAQRPPSAGQRSQHTRRSQQQDSLQEAERMRAEGHEQPVAHRSLSHERRCASTVATTKTVQGGYFLMNGV